MVESEIPQGAYSFDRQGKLLVESEILKGAIVIIEDEQEFS